MFKESECLFRSKTLLGINTKKIAKGPKEKFCQTSIEAANEKKLKVGVIRGFTSFCSGG